MFPGNAVLSPQDQALVLPVGYARHFPAGTDRSGHCLWDIIVAKEKQAAAKQTFVFLATLTSKRPMKSDRERESACLRVLMI